MGLSRAGLAETVNLSYAGNLSKYMKIVLVRHGRPASAENIVVDSVGFAKWVKAYDKSLVSSDSRPSQVLRDKFKGFYIVSSDLPRAIHSSSIALDLKPHHQSRLLREMEIPRYKLPFAFKAFTWVYINRLLWMLGKKGPFESYTEARARAKKAAHELVQTAKVEGKVIVFAHGYLNLHMRKYLRKAGFVQQSTSNGYWGISEFEAK